MENQANLTNAGRHMEAIGRIVGALPTSREVNAVVDGLLAQSARDGGKNWWCSYCLKWVPPAPGLQIGMFRLSPGRCCPGSIHIEKPDGEGGEFDASKLEQHLEAFYDREF
jgi:hypothetical protein